MVAQVARDPGFVDAEITTVIRMGGSLAAGVLADQALVRGRPSMRVFTGTYLVLNPASPISITMTADEVRTFATGS